MLTFYIHNYSKLYDFCQIGDFGRAKMEAIWMITRVL
nr:MAG TPA: hypothetical protein [Caudoviricetes sp.]